MNALQMTTKAFARHGVDLPYTSVVTGLYDPEQARPAVVKTTYTLKMYPKQFFANQYNFPTLVGKENILFYLSAEGLGFIPKVNDEVEYKGKKYKVYDVQEHFANASVALYKLTSSRG
jgi:hypothetical protein